MLEADLAGQARERLRVVGLDDARQLLGQLFDAANRSGCLNHLGQHLGRQLVALLGHFGEQGHEGDERACRDQTPRGEVGARRHDGQLDQEHGEARHTGDHGHQKLGANGVALDPVHL